MLDILTQMSGFSIVATVYNKFEKALDSCLQHPAHVGVQIPFLLLFPFPADSYDCNQERQKRPEE